MVPRSYLGKPTLAIANDGGDPVELVSITFTGMAPGETRFLTGRMAALSEAEGRMWQYIELGCTPHGQERISSGRNHEGKFYGGTGDSYVRDADDRPVLTHHVRYLFRAPHTAGRWDYTCALKAGKKALDGTNARLVALRSVIKEGRELTGTWLESTYRNRQGAHWVDMFSDETSDFNCQPSDLFRRCQPWLCESQDTDNECQYIYPDEGPIRILEMKVQKKDLRVDWRPEDYAIVYADFALTSCYLIRPKSIEDGKWSCNKFVEPRALDSSVDAYVLYRLEVADIDSTGRPEACSGSADASKTPGWTFWPTPGQGYRGGDYRRERISLGMHHKKFYTQLSRRTSANPDCSRLLVRVYLKADYGAIRPDASGTWRRVGQPIKIDASRFDNDGFFVTLSNGAIWLTR
jgi:hypothetical protein